MGAVLRAKSGTGDLSRLRAEDRSQVLRSGHLARLRQLHGQPHLLHHLQQGFPRGLQEGVAVQIPQSGVAAGQVGFRPRATGDYHQQSVNEPEVTCAACRREPRETIRWKKKKRKRKNETRVLELERCYSLLARSTRVPCWTFDRFVDESRVSPSAVLPLAEALPIDVFRIR